MNKLYISIKYKLKHGYFVIFRILNIVIKVHVIQENLVIIVTIIIIIIILLP